MKHIDTTETTVEKMKRAAKKLRKESEKPHHECLEIVAREHGYEHWHHVTVCANNTKGKQ